MGTSASGPANRSGQAKSADGVPLHDQRLDLVADLQLLEVLQPPLRPEQRVVRAEQHFVLQQRVGRTHQLWREVLRRPAGEVDVGVGLVLGDGDRGVLPGHGGVGHDDGQVREVGGDVIKQHRVGVAQLDAAPARQARADAGLPGVEERRDAQGLQLFVQRIVLPVVGLEGLQARVELEPAHPVLLDEPPGSADAGRPARRVDRAEGDEDVGVLAGLAVRLELADVFVEGSDPDKVLAALGERGEAGTQWLAALEEAKDPWFNVSVGDGFYHHLLSWADDLTVPFAALPRYVEQIAAGEDLTRPTERLAEERERIAQEYRALLGTEDEQAAFDQMLGLCRLVFPYIESHKFYCEHWFTTRFFQKIRAFGQLLAERGVLVDADDVFHLRHVEVEDALADVQLAWASGGTELGARHWQPIVAERKRIVEALAGWSAPPALGPVPEALNDPAVQMLWGVTDETVETWLGDEELDENVVRGYAASPGVVEGVARVLMNVNDIGQIREGEILVCPVTAPSWGPVFGKIAAAVSDIGGTMSHAAIVAREYGMPAVVGSGTATAKIRTGDRVRVDGDRGIVTILR